MATNDDVDECVVELPDDEEDVEERYLELGENDAAIILRSDGSVEAFIPRSPSDDEDEELVNEAGMRAVLLLRALDNESLMDRLYDQLKAEMDRQSMLS